MAKFISLASFDHNRPKVRHVHIVRPELDLNPRQEIPVTFRRGPDLIAESQRMRNRDIAMLKCFLLGGAPEDIAVHHGCSVAVTRKSIAKAMRFLYFRCADRGTGDLPTKMVDIRAQADFWLARFDATEAAMRELDPANLSKAMQ